MNRGLSTVSVHKTLLNYFGTAVTDKVTDYYHLACALHKSKTEEVHETVYVHNHSCRFVANNINPLCVSLKPAGLVYRPGVKLPHWVGAWSSCRPSSWWPTM